MPEFTARPAILKMLLLLLAAIGFVVIGVWLAGLLGPAPDPGNQWAGWLSILFFGPCAVVIFRRLFDRDEQVRISSFGICYKQWSPAVIPWSAIADVSVWEYSGQKSIILHLHDPAAFPFTKLLGRLARANRALTGGDIAITLTGTDGRFADAMAAIDWFRANQRSDTDAGRFGRRR